MKKRRRGRGEGAAFFSDAKGVWVGRAVVGERPDGRPKYKEVTARSKAELLAKLRAARDAGTPTALTVAAMLAGWLENVARPTVEPTTLAVYERTIRVHLDPGLGRLKLSALTPERVEGFFAEMHRNGASPGLARKVRQVLQTALKNAVAKKVIPASPTDNVPQPRQQSREIEPFSPGEVRRALAAADHYRSATGGVRYAALFALAFATGARQGELLALGWEHLDLERGLVRIERSLCIVDGEFRLKAPKSKRGRRVVSLPPFAVEALVSHREKMEAEGRLAAPVFCTASTGGFLNGKILRRLWAGLLKRAGVPHRKFHNARHTHASQLLSLGVSLMEVARRIGDHPETVLRVYAHWMPADERVPDHLEAINGRQGGDKVEGGPKPAERPPEASS